MTPEAELALFKSLANLKGQVDGRDGEFPCDLSGTRPGHLTGTDIIDYIQDDLNAFRGVSDTLIPEESRAEVLSSYVEAYNKVAGRARYG